jgi:sigma-E factor negative regulatory protein RseA
MNEERHNERDSQLSAMFDGELTAAECELLARRLSRDEVLRTQWSRYALIGAAVRAERGVALHDRVAWRVQSTIAQEAAYGDAAALDVINSGAVRTASGKSAPTAGFADRWMRFARPVMGAGIAAGVAATSILWMRTQDNPDAALLASNPVPAPAAQVVAAPPANGTSLALNASPVAARQPIGGGSGEPGVYTTPAPSTQSSIAPPARLANYVVAHSEYSGPLARRLALLSLVGNEVAADAGTAEESVAPPKAEAAGNGR